MPKSSAFPTNVEHNFRRSEFQVEALSSEFRFDGETCRPTSVSVQHSCFIELNTSTNIDWLIDWLIFIRETFSSTNMCRTSCLIFGNRNHVTTKMYFHHYPYWISNPLSSNSVSKFRLESHETRTRMLSELGLVLSVVILDDVFPSVQYCHQTPEEAPVGRAVKFVGIKNFMTVVINPSPSINLSSRKNVWTL